MRRPKFRKLLLILIIFTLISYLTVFISPAVFWPIGLFNYLIPVLISLQFAIFFFLLFFRKYRKYSLYSLIVILLGYYFINDTFNFPWPSNKNPPSDFKVLSFNARYFRAWSSYRQLKYKTVEWLIDEDSGVKCIQEYSTNPEDKLFDNTLRFIKKGYYAHTYTIQPETNENGLAIFSKYPIVNKGFILLNENSHNNCIYADIKIHEDTIRVYNFHLKSMGLDLSKFTRPKSFSSNSKETVTKLGSSSSKRAVEIHKILTNVESCPYPYILACDMNELIYGNNYYRLRKKAHDTFEDAGTGFGFTFNGRILFFIRIDHQFHSNEIISTGFKVIRNIKTSDHFPVKGWYKLK